MNCRRPGIGALLPSCRVLPVRADETDVYPSAFILKYRSPALSIGCVSERPGGLRSSIPAERRTAIVAHLRDQQRFAFLECEDLGEAPAVRFGNVIRSICRYRITTSAGSVNYTFEFTPGGKVARLVPEKD